MKMKTYKGTKVIMASEEMSRQEYCDYRGWKLPEDEDGDDRVYLVEYAPEPGSKPNHPGHTGYISMSPKAVFDKAYRICETHVDRMMIEREDLRKKIDDAKTALNYGKVPENAVAPLSDQVTIMEQYTDLLNVRINGISYRQFGFGVALAHLKQGRCVRRVSWYVEDKFIFRQVPSQIEKVTVPKMQSVPAKAKDLFEKEFVDRQIDAIYYDNQVAMVSISNLVTGWSPSISDCFAEDWVIVE